MRISDWSSDVCSAGQVVSYAADLPVSNPTLELRPGMTATADIITSEQKDALLVPNAALRFTPQTEGTRSEEHTSELQALMRISYAVYCMKKKKHLSSH